MQMKHFCDRDTIAKYSAGNIKLYKIHIKNYLYNIYIYIYISKSIFKLHLLTDPLE